jgi:two-component system, OmpR family, phosphate regulon sensor histidine kinase PhoR
MTRTKLLILSVLMSLAVLGLIFFQLYWIRTAVQIKEEELARNVQEALVEVSQKLEKQEVIRFSYQQGNITIWGGNQIEVTKVPQPAGAPAPPAPKGATSLSSGNLYRAMPGQTDYVVVPPAGQPSGNTITVIPMDSLRRRVKVEDGRLVWHTRETEKGTSRPGEVIAYQEAARVLEDRLQKRQQMDNFYLRQFRSEELSLKKRIDSLQIDTLLRQALRHRGIDADYHWAVVEGPHKQLVYRSAHVLTDTASLYQAALFPNDIFRSNSYLSVYFPNQTRYLLSRMGATMASSALLILIVMGCFAYAVQTILRQKQLREMKNDFVNNMTHELKTPIATVSMACEALADPDLLRQPNILERYLGIIRQENRRLGQQVEKVLQIARLERQKPSLKLESVAVHELIENIVEIYRLQLPPGGRIGLSLEAANSMLQADRLHLTGILNNLLENAIKYSEGPPQIEVHTSNTNLQHQPALAIQVADKGIGISRENQDKIFDKFYRVPTGNLHNVKGFGLGLAFVRYSTEAHGGRIEVHSKPGAGSQFTVTLPLTQRDHAKN